jgi:hypothetical protein
MYGIYKADSKSSIRRYLTIAVCRPGQNYENRTFRGETLRARVEFAQWRNKLACLWASTRVSLLAAQAFKRPAAGHEQPADFFPQPCARSAGVSFYGAAAQFQPFGRFFNGIAFKIAQVEYLPRSCGQSAQRLVQQSTHFSPDTRAVGPGLLALKRCRRSFSLAGRACLRNQWNIVAPPTHDHDGFIQPNSDQPGGQLRIAAELRNVCESFQQSFLEDVFRVVVVGGDFESAAENDGGRSLGEYLESFWITSLCSLQQGSC